MTKDGTMLENDVTADKRRHECLTDSTPAETAMWLPLAAGDGTVLDTKHEC